LKDANANLAEMKQDLIAWAAGSRYDANQGGLFKRNGLQLGCGGFLALCAWGLYALGFRVWWIMAFMAALCALNILSREWKRYK